MKKALSLMLAMGLLAGILSACSNGQAESQTDAAGSDPNGYEEDIFEGGETVTTEVTEATETTNATTESTQPAQTQTPTTQPTESQAPTTQPTQPTETQAPTTAPTEPATDETTAPTTGTEPAVDEATLALAKEYEAYLAMTASQRTAFRSTFANYDAFFAWYNAAMEAHKIANPPIEIGPDGIIDLG